MTFRNLFYVFFALFYIAASAAPPSTLFNTLMGLTDQQTELFSFDNQVMECRFTNTGTLPVRSRCILFEKDQILYAVIGTDVDGIKTLQVTKTPIRAEAATGDLNETFIDYDGDGTLDAFRYAGREQTDRNALRTAQQNWARVSMVVQNEIRKRLAAASI